MLLQGHGIKNTQAFYGKASPFLNRVPAKSLLLSNRVHRILKSCSVERRVILVNL